MNQYLLSVYQPDQPPPEPAFLARVTRDVDALTVEMKSAGVWVFGNGLEEPESATVLRAGEDDVSVSGGPLSDATEHLGAITIINAPDVDTALDWGRRLALATTLPVEVRQFQVEAGQ